jgi:5-methylcytosine-specific restriction endonuclease McrA
VKSKTRNSGNWTEGRYTTFIRSALRAAFRKWPPKFEVLRNAATERRINPKSGKLAMHYRCAGCGKEFPLKDIQVDHVKPIVDPKVGFVDWNTFIDRLYCEAKNLQVLCRDVCHALKSKKERATRKKHGSK